MNCPDCGHPLHGLGTRCWAGANGCGWYEGKAASPSSGAKCDQSPLPPRCSDEPRTVVFPWGLLVSVNDRKGGMVGKLSEKYRTRLAAMRKQAKADLAHLAPLSGPVSMAVTYHPPDRRKRDCHNYDKAIADALIGSAYVDDEQIIEWRGRKMPKSDSPRAEVQVAPLLEVA